MDKLFWLKTNQTKRKCCSVGVPESNFRLERFTISVAKVVEEDRVGLGIKSRALPIHALLSSLLVLLFGNPHLLEGSLEDGEKVNPLIRLLVLFPHFIKSQFK